MEIESNVPQSRIYRLNQQPVNTQGKWVLYWMVAFRRSTWNFSLQRAVDWAVALRRPLLIFEPLRADYPWCSARLHQIVLDGMRDNRAAFAEWPVAYYPYAEPVAGASRGSLECLARESCLVISDDFPCSFLPKMFAAAQRVVSVRFELIDSNGLYPMRATSRLFSRAVDFRRHLQRVLPDSFQSFPCENPLSSMPLPRLDQADLPDGFKERWPATMLDKVTSASFPVDQNVKPLPQKGGSLAASFALREFAEKRLRHYDLDRNQVDRASTSELSGYLHFGHISSHQIFRQLMEPIGWEPKHVGQKATGSSTGWWGAPASIEAFLDQIVTWRELGFNFCALSENYDQFESLPSWARQTLGNHERDLRPVQYSLEQFEASQTRDPIWNAAQNQLRVEGRIQNYLRMLWGKKILEWSASPREALNVMIHLNNKYAIDGRNPNSYSGIFWTLGRYDRPWGPERPIFGTIRYMSSANTAKKLKLKNYLARFQSMLGSDPVYGFQSTIGEE